MSQRSVAIVRVVTLGNAASRDQHGRFLETLFPHWRTISVCISDQPMGISDSQSESAAVPKIIALAHKVVAANEHLSGMIVSCAADPGVRQLQAELSLPVVGAGAPGAALALVWGSNVGVLGITAEAPAVMRNILKEQLLIYSRPQGIRSTWDLQTSWGREAVFQAARSCRAAGADVIALACTGMATAGFAAVLRRELNIPVVDPVAAAGLALQSQFCTDRELFALDSASEGSGVDR